MISCYEQFNQTDAFDSQLIDNIPFLKKIAAKYIKDEEDVKDLIQDTVYKAIKNKHRFKTNTNLRGWLVTILKNTYINQYHKNRYRKYSVDSDPALLEGEKSQDPILNPISCSPKEDNKYHFPDYYNIIIRNLSYDFQILVLMCDIEGYTYQQIAEYLNCPVGTVRSRLYRGRKFMVKTYQKLMRSGQI